MEGQKATLASVRWSLRLGVLAAAAGATTWRLGPGELDVLAGIGILAFGASLFVALAGAGGSSDERWYRCRAIAESAKTLAWRYAVRGDPFPDGLPGGEADRLFLDRISRVVEEAGQLQLAPGAGPQITEAMRSIRNRPLTERRESYCVGRIEDQMNWYASNAKKNGDSARRWGRVVIVADLAGIVGALGLFLNWWDLQLLGLAATGAGAALGWLQLKQHRTLASSYALAAQELALVRDRLDLIDDESVWASEVSDAEDAISREHTMWLARHGHLRA